MRMQRVVLIILVSLAALTVRARAANDPLGGYVFDVPAVGHATVGADKSGWAAGGFQVNAMSPERGELLPASDTATVRLDWDRTGLVVLASVTKPQITLADNSVEIWNRDCVELSFASRRGGADYYQWAVSPGVTPEQPTDRTRFFDTRQTESLKSIPLTCQESSIRTASGYRVAATFPWANLGIKPRAGLEFGFQATVDLWDGDKLIHLVWYPTVNTLATGTLADTHELYNLRLTAGAPSPSVSAAAVVDVERFRRLHVTVVANPSLTGTLVKLVDGTKTVASTAVRATGCRAGAEFTLPLPPPSGPAEHALFTSIVVSGHSVPFLAPGLATDRRLAFLGASFKFPDGPIFDGSVFSEGDFEDPNFVEDVAGRYTVKTTYYNANFNPVTSASAPGRYGAVSRIATASGMARTVCTTLYRTYGPIWPDVYSSIHGTLSVSPEGFGIDPQVAKERSGDIDQAATMMVRDSFWSSESVAVFCAGMSETKPGEPDIHRTDPESRDQQWWSTLKGKLHEPLYPYLVFLPDGYTPAAAPQKWPMLVFLHGSGLNPYSEEGMRRVLKHEGLPGPAAARFILVAPMCPPNERWNPWEVIRLINAVSAQYRVDPDRVYLTGSSMGGTGTYDTATAFPDRFAAIAPMSGFGDPPDAARLANVPIWAQHGDQDRNVPFTADKANLDAVVAAGGHVRFTDWAGRGHEICWQQAYRVDGLFDWLLAQTRGHPAQPVGLDLAPEPWK